MSICIWKYRAKPTRYIFSFLIIVWHFQSSSSPRRVAVPVLVKDGKPCSGSGQGGGGGGQGVGGGNGGGVSEGGRAPPSPTSCVPVPGSGYGPQHSQLAATMQQCNNTLMANSSIAMAAAYRNQNNFINNSHQQQCSAYLPLQGRAW